MYKTKWRMEPEDDTISLVQDMYLWVMECTCMVVKFLVRVYSVRGGGSGVLLKFATMHLSSLEQNLK